MVKIKAVWKNNQLVFKNFIVKKESDNFVGVYSRGGQYCAGHLITSATTLKQAAQKAKLLELGYAIGYQDAKDIYTDNEYNY